VQEKMQLLKDLQELDQELNRIAQHRRKLEAEDAVLRGDRDRVQAMVDTLTGDIERLQEQRRELTQALALEQENVKKVEGRLPSIQTQKEYLAVLKEIDTAKKTNKDINDRIAEKDREISALAKECEEKNAELSQVSERVSGRQAQIAEALGESDQALGEKAGLRDSMLNELPIVLQKRYRLLMDRRAGVAVVEARNGACLGCNMHLPPQLYNSLFRSTEIQACPHCNRLLFVEKVE
jgi:uncharacterized protein